MIVLLVIALSAATNALTAYDCAHANANITTISSHHVTPCRNSPEPSGRALKYVQVLVVKKYDTIETIKCSITRSSLITYCGVASHSVAMPQGLSVEDSIPISASDCLNLLSTGTYITPFQHTISGIKVNSRTRVRVTDVGQLSSEASCSGVDFNLYGQSYKKSVMQSQYSISIIKGSGTVSLSSNEIVFPEGYRCKYNTGSCMTEGATYTWAIKEMSAVCGRTVYNVLYEGYANITTSEGNVQIVMVESTDQRFAIATTGERPICGFTGFTTERDSLFVLQGAPGTLPAHEDRISMLDIATYLDSDLKFVYIERNIWNRTTDLYDYFMKRYCELNTAHLTSMLSLSRLNPEEFAWSYMRKEGYTAITRGEVTHLIQCQKVSVVPRPSPDCFMELPVSYNNESYFVKPGTRVLVRTGRPVECAPTLPVMYFVNNMWMKIGGVPSMQSTPKTLDPNPSSLWTYGEIKSLHHLGILTSDQVRKYQQSILLPLEREAVQEAFISNAEGITNYYPQGVNYGNSINNEEYLTSITSRVITKIYGIWDFVVKYLGAILGLAILWDLLTGILSVIINLFFLYRRYGFSSILLFAIWSTGTKHILYGDPTFLRRRFKKTSNDPENIDDNNDEHNTLYPSIPIVNIKPNAPSNKPPAFSPINFN